MTDGKQRGRKRKRGGRRDKASAGSATASRIRLCRVDATGDAAEYEFVFPRDVREREDDLEEVRRMLEMGEIDVAVDELRWLVGGCEGLLEGHRLLGEIAAEEGDWELARAHFGYAYDLGLKALPQGFAGRLPFRRLSNRPMFYAADGLARCLVHLGDFDQAKAIWRQMATWDPDDPLQAVRKIDDPKSCLTD
ncbi:MAG: hypothetical protein D6741_12040, partial [Planctomycetota bacterium]